jgi:hypothetical protein
VPLAVAVVLTVFGIWAAVRHAKHSYSSPMMMK